VKSKYIPRPVYYSSKVFFSQETGKKNTEDASQSSSKYKEAFQDLKSKINVGQSQENLKKMAQDNTFSDVKEKISQKFGATEQSNTNQQSNANNTAQANATSQNAGQSQGNTSQSNPTADQTVNNTQTTPEGAQNVNPQGQEKKQVEKKPSFTEKISAKSPFLGKVLNYVAESWEETFPSDKYHQKAALNRQKAKEAKAREAAQANYTEEELAKVQIRLSVLNIRCKKAFLKE